EREQPQQLVVADIPVLFEAGWAETFAEIMVVYVPEAVQLQRLMEREGLAAEEALGGIRAQMPIERKKQLGHVVIDNSGSVEETEQQVEAYWRRKGLPEI